MSRPGDAAGPGRHRAPAGLLETLVSAVRPEFRGEVITVDPADPVFGGPPCQVEGCTRTARLRGMCQGHYDRWKYEGRPAVGEFTAATDPEMHGHRALQPCDVPGCGLRCPELSGQGNCG